MTDSEMLDFMAEYVDSFSYMGATQGFHASFVLDVPMVGIIRSTVSLRDAIEQANKKFQELNS